MTTLKEILAFNEEIVGLRRAGSSVNLGMPRDSTAMDARLNELISELSGRSDAELGQGSAATEDRLLNSTSLPSVYQKTVEVGLRHGRIAAGFESITESAKVSRRLRKQARVEMSYPILILVIACTLMTFLATKIIPTFHAAQESLRLPASSWSGWTGVVSDFGVAWRFIPLIFFFAAVLFLWWYGKSGSKEGYLSCPLWLPGYRGFERDLKLANFAQTLLLLRQREIPKREAISLASSVSGHRIATDKSGQQIASNAVPPLLSWAILESGQQDNDASEDSDSEDDQSNADDLGSVELNAMAFAADFYQARAEKRARLISKTMPVLAIVCIGGLIVYGYALTIWGPFCEMLNELSSLQNGGL